MRAGLSTIVPLPLLALFSWRDVEHMVCGEPGFDMEVRGKGRRRTVEEKKRRKGGE